MKIFFINLSLAILLISSSMISQQLNRKISVNSIDDEVILKVDNQLHEDYGLTYPVTYEITIPQNSSGLKAYRKFFASMNWSQLQEKTSDDFFNGIEAVRFDYGNNAAYISAAFHRITDSLLIKITDNMNNKVAINFKGISKYYDNRDAAVTVTADDWHMSFSQYFITSLNHFRHYNLWVTAGIVTDEGWCNQTTWQQIQQQLNLGFVEAASHSRNHLHTPYSNSYYEVTGSKEDIINKLDLPDAFSKGDKEYVYIWIAPYGQYDDSIDYYVSANKYLTSRLTNEQDYFFSDWEEDKNKFASIGIAYEMGEASWAGVHDLDSLNNTFDRVTGNGEIYHLMFHPHVLAQYNSWNDGYVIDHLEHISNKKNIWYTPVGHLYLYHLLEYDKPQTAINNLDKKVLNFNLEQNYPNPFNPGTKIIYNIEEDCFVNLNIYDILGNLVQTLVNENKMKGKYEIIYNASSAGGGLAGGVYIYQLKAGMKVTSKKMILIK